MARNLGVLLHSALSSIYRPRSENARHAKRAWRRHGHKFSFSKLVLWLTIVFLFLPLFVIIIYSFNASKGAEFTKGETDERFDVNGDGEINIADINAIVKIILGIS